MRNFTFSVVIPTRKNPACLWLSIKSVLQHSPPDTELLIVPDLIAGPESCSQDPATVGLAEGCAARNGGIPVMVIPRTEGASGFATSANIGLQNARGKYLVVLHDDAHPTAGWLDGLRAALLAASSAIPDVRWGYAGPMSNFAMSAQALGEALPGANDPSQCAQTAAFLRTQAQDEFIPSGPLDSFCLMMTRAAYEKVGGFDERFNPGGHEDVDLILRGQEAGFMACRASRVFVYHAGRKTLGEVGLGPHGDIPNQQLLMEKYFPAPGSDRPDKTLCFMVRVQINTIVQADNFCIQMKQLAQLGDSAVIVDDRSSYETSVVDLLKSAEAGLRDFVVDYRKNPAHLAPNIKRDRNLLLQMGRETGADWLMGVEPGHVFDSKVTRETFHHLMTPADPTIRAYQYPIRVCWKDDDTLRVDGQWGHNLGCAFFRNLPWGNMLQLTGTPLDTFPTCIPEEQISVTAKLVLYDRNYVDLAAAREAGFIFTETPVMTIPDRSPTFTHLLMVKNEMSEMPRQLAQHQHWADDIIVCDNGSTDGLKDLCDRFAIRYVDVRCCDQADDPQHMVCDFGAARNRCVDACTTEYIEFADADEEFTRPSYELIPFLLMENADGYLCDINNHQRNPKTNQLQVYVTLQARVFRKHPLLRYEPEVHETLEHAFKRHKNVLGLVKSELTIEHYGYVRENADERKWKGEKYTEKLLTCIKANPNDARSVYALGQHLNSIKQYDDGDHLIGKALALDGEFFTARLELGLRLMRRAYEVFASTPNSSVPTEDKREAIRSIIRTLQPWVGSL